MAARPSARRRLLVHLLTATWLVVTAASLLVPRDPDLGDHFRWLPVPVDKAAHFLLFFGCTLVLHRSFRVEARTAPLASAAVLSLAYGLVTEGMQRFVPDRVVDPADAAADGLGVAAYVGMAWCAAMASGGSRGEVGR